MDYACNATKPLAKNKKFKKPKTQKNYKIKKPKIKCHTKDCIENNANKFKARNSNKIAHVTFGNKTKSHYKIIQINTSNADFCTKLHELKSTINSNMSEIIIIS